jgi:hypothetical protein
MAEAQLWIRNGQTKFRGGEAANPAGHGFLSEAGANEANQDLLAVFAAICWQQRYRRENMPGNLPGNIQ